MKKMLVGFLLLSCLNAFANDVVLGPDKSITISCSATGPGNVSIGETYAELPYSHKLNILKNVGIGSCRVELLSGNFNFFYSDRYTNGIHLNNNSKYMINQALKNGECSI